MKNSRFRESQIVSILKEADAGAGKGNLPPPRDQRGHLLQLGGKYGGMNASDLKRLKEGEGELSQ